MRRLFSRFSVRLYALLATFAIGLLLLSTAALTLQWRSLYGQRVAMLASLADTASHIIDYNRALVEQGAMTEQAAKARAMAELLSIRYGNNDYFFVFDTKMVVIGHPDQKAVGKDFTNFQDLLGFKYVADVIPRAIRDGTAFVTYHYTRLGSTDAVPKIGVFRYSPQWGWVVSTGTYIDDLNATFWRQAFWLAGIATGLLIILAVIGAALIRSTVTPLRRLVETMTRLSAGHLEDSIPDTDSLAEISAMAQSLAILRDSAIAKRQLEQQTAQEREAAEAARRTRTTQDEVAAAAQTRVVETVADGLAQIAEGDLTIRLQQPFAPQYEKLRQDFNDAVDALSQTLGAIAGEVGTLRSGIGEITSAANDLSRRTEQQAAGLEETAAALDEITVTVNKSAERTRDARGLVTSTKAEVTTGSSIMQNAVAAMTTIEASSNRVGEIIGVIDEIAFQTNLLALNAGVEAARAGDSGRGFAVVASEVRALAQRSAEAAKEIKSLIQSSSEQIRSGVQLVTQTGQSLGTIVGKIGQIDDVVAEIAVGASEQASALLQVNGAVNDMDKSTQHNASMVEQTTQANRSLAEKVDELASMIDRFKLSGSTANDAPAPQGSRRDRPLQLAS